MLVKCGCIFHSESNAFLKMKKGVEDIEYAIIFIINNIENLI
jgi:hypothetical protein